MPSRYQVAGRPLATAATADHFSTLLWNPSSVKPLWVREIWLAKTVATADYIQLARTSSAGATPTGTVTPDIDNDRDRQLAPGTGALLYTGTFGTQPTIITPPLARYAFPAAIGSGVMLVFDPPIRVAPGEGLGIAAAVATVVQPEDATYVWEE